MSRAASVHGGGARSNEATRAPVSTPTDSLVSGAQGNGTKKWCTDTRVVIVLLGGRVPAMSTSSPVRMFTSHGCRVFANEANGWEGDRRDDDMYVK